MALVCGSCGVTGKLTDASASVYSRHDDDETTVWSPRTHVAGQIEERATVEAAYMMDAWSSASIDIRTSATPVVREIRHEVEAGAGYQFDDATLSAGYRYSTENDYWSHGAVLTLALDLAEKSTTLALSAVGAHDLVGKYGDRRFERPLDSVGGRFTWTQILTPESLVQLSWETMFLTGFQASPYRWVALGVAGLCAGDAPYCIPEYVPDQRFRHAVAAEFRHALGAHGSGGAAYRAYADSWGVRSHTLEPSITFRFSDAVELSADYRYYTQNEAGFYRPRYGVRRASTGYATRDRKLSAMYSHAAGLSYAHRVSVGTGGAALRFALRGSGTLYRYLAYVGLDEVRAIEVTGLVGFEHR
jgi:hypothetical protein